MVEMFAGMAVVCVFWFVGQGQALCAASNLKKATGVGFVVQVLCAAINLKMATGVECSMMSIDDVQ